MIGRTTEASVIVGLALVLTIAVAVPVLRAPSERIFGMEIVGRHHDPFTVMEQFNRPRPIGLHMQPLTDIPGALLRARREPSRATTGLVLRCRSAVGCRGACPRLATCAFAADRRRASAAIAPFTFLALSSCPRAYHPHIAQTQWIPLYFLALWRCLDNASWRAVALLAGSIVGVTLSNFYGGLIAAVMTPIAIAIYWFFTSRAHSGSRRSLAITIGSLAVVAVSGVAYARYAAAGVIANRAAFAFERDDLFRYSAKWWGYLVPPVEHPLRNAARIQTAQHGRAARTSGEPGGSRPAVLGSSRGETPSESVIGHCGSTPWRSRSSHWCVHSSPERTIGWFTSSVRPPFYALPMFRSTRGWCCGPAHGSAAGRHRRRVAVALRHVARADRMCRTSSAGRGRIRRPAARVVA
jgi:hypothetical protein